MEDKYHSSYYVWLQKESHKHAGKTWNYLGDTNDTLGNINSKQCKTEIEQTRKHMIRHRESQRISYNYYVTN